MAGIRLHQIGQPGAQPPAASFEQPFEMLTACHERVERMLRLLHRLCQHLDEKGLDEQAAQAARDVMRYFDLAAPDHHEDEERHVFPRLLAGTDEHAKAVVRRLQQDHRDMTANWVSAREVLQRVSEGSAPTWSGLGEADRATLARFADLYADHIRAEEDTVYPAASALIDAPELQRIGAEMADRRTARP
ncbi:MAG: hemerythrin domain-containing protein [Hydrogenophaga sp.]|uniref:hemerythrin domain-containing protein n=1 Tax=Hydrogenophaga sp. TaxID=1904254 RepID=UPI0027303A2B|nr:hemerythrin domain-containing protein [Hydrogenophaga sp.]MDP2404836.1 hemerythrin domain-containing protein [Hydrogenophaga sp.]MDZ4173491.1 hemerythrin domain-containing protein [Hydrogenophaga sp.]